MISKTQTRNILLAVLALGMIGCSSSNPTRLEVSGEVTMDGKPLENATIQFHPEQELIVLGKTRVIQGAFSMVSPEGLPVGEYDVTIIPAEPEFEEIEIARRRGDPSPLRRVMIPKDYQQPGKLTATVTQEGSREFNFALKSISGSQKGGPDENMTQQKP